MKKLALLLVLVCTIFGASLAPAAAAPVADLTALAGYFPADVPIYVGMRTDDAFIDELDHILGTVGAKLPGVPIPPSLSLVINQGLSQILGPDATFESAVRPWLGDAAAFGLLSLDTVFGMSMGGGGAPQMLFVVDITDRAAAEAFVDQLVALNVLPLVKTTENGATVYVEGEPVMPTEEPPVDPSVTAEPDATQSPEAGLEATPEPIVWVVSPDADSKPALAITDDVILYGSMKSVLPLNSDFLSLDKQEGFSVVGRLPGQDYNVVAYANVGNTFHNMLSGMSSQLMQMGGDMMFIQSLLPIYENFPTMAVGLAVVDQKSVIIDLAQNPFDYSALADTPFSDIDPTAILNSGPADLSFVQHIPADATFATQGTALGTKIDYMLDAIEIIANVGLDTWRSSMSGQMDSMPRMVNDIDGSTIRAFIDLGFAGFTGLNLQDDVLAHIDGNSALFGRILSTGAGTMPAFDGALVIEVTDAAAVQHIFDRIKVALDRYKTDYSNEGDTVFVLPNVIRGFYPQSFSSDMMSSLDAEATAEADVAAPADPLADPAFDFLVGYNDQVVAIGSRHAVEFALNGASGSLSDDPTYQEAAAQFLPNTQSLAYINASSINNIVGLVSGMMPGASMGAQLGLVEGLIGLFDSASVTSTIGEDLGVNVRLVLTLSQALNAPVAPPAEAAAPAEMTPEATPAP